MKKYLFLISAAALFFAAGCEKNQGGGNFTPDTKAPIKISTSITRATDTEFENDDKIGLYVVNYNGSAHDLTADANHINNVGFTYDGSVWTPDEEVFWKDMTTHADFYAYYPHTATIADVNAVHWTISADQSTEADYWAGDFLWIKKADVTPTLDAVELEMTHILSNAIITLTKGTGFDATADEWENAKVEMYLYGVKTAADIDLATGVATAKGSATVVTPWNTGTKAYRAMVIPQTIAAGEKLISVSVDGIVYSLDLEEDFEFVAGKKHEFNLTINESKVSLNVTLKDWEDDENPTNAEAPATSNSKSIELPSTSWTALTDATLYGSYWGGTQPTAALQNDYPDVTYAETSFKQAGATSGSELEKIWDNYTSPDAGHNGTYTYMDSCWNSPNGQTYPFSIFIDLGSVVQIDALRLFCRGGRADKNMPGQFEIWVSDDNTPENGILDGWVKVCEHDARVSAVGTWADKYELAYVDGYEVKFDARTKPCRYVRFKAVADRNNGAYDTSTVSIAELKLFGVQHNF